MSFIRQMTTMISRAFTSKPLIFILILSSQIISIMCVFFAFGLVFNAFVDFKNVDLSERNMMVNLFEHIYANDVDPTIYDLEFYGEDKENGRYYIEFTEEQQAQWDEWYVDFQKAYAEAEKLNQESIENGMHFDEFSGYLKEILSGVEDNIMVVKLIGHAYYDDEYRYATSWYIDEESEDYVYSSKNGVFVQYKNHYELGDIIVIDGINYIVEQKVEVPGISFNLDDTPPGFIVENLYIEFKNPLTYVKQVQLVNKIKTLLHPTNLFEPETPKLLEVQMNNSQIAISLVLTAVVVFNCALCYTFIYQKRKKMFAIFRICGAQKEHCFYMCVSEVMLYALASFGAAYLIFDNFLKKLVILFYPLAEEAYSAKSYLYILAVYLLATLIIMSYCIYFFIRKPIVEERR